MTHAGPAGVLVNRRAKNGRTPVALVLCAALVTSQAHAQDGGVVLSDAPVVRKLPSGEYLFNKPAFERVDVEMRRLQAVERLHQGEPAWTTPVIVGLAVGLVLGLGAGLSASAVVDALKKSP